MTRRIDSTGAPQGPGDGELVTASINTKEHPSLVTDGAGGAFAAWWDDRNGTIYETDFDIFAHLISSGGPVAVPADLAPRALWLGNAAPNPSHGSTSFAFRATRRGVVSITLFDLLGRRVRRLFERTMEPGLATVTWDGVDDRGIVVPNGVYLCRLESGGESRCRRIVVSR